MEQPFLQLLQTQALPIAFVVLFLASIIEYVFPPFPGDTVFLFGAFLVGRDLLPIWLVFLSGSLGSFAGSLALYSLGKAKGRDYFIKRNFSFFSAEKVRALEDRFARWGGIIIVANRFAPGFRPFFFVAAGIARMPLFAVAVYSLVSITAWNLGIFYLGFRLGQQWEKMKGFVQVYSVIVFSFISAVIIVYVVLMVIEVRRKNKGTTGSGKGV
jgi:membrane protein DedA with SNARE-associated domain